MGKLSQTTLYPLRLGEGGHVLPSPLMGEGVDSFSVFS